DGVAPRASRRGRSAVGAVAELGGPHAAAVRARDAPHRVRVRELAQLRVEALELVRAHAVVRLRRRPDHLERIERGPPLDVAERALEAGAVLDRLRGGRLEDAA